MNNCDQCGEQFWPRDCRSRFCSQACRDKYRSTPNYEALTNEERNELKALLLAGLEERPGPVETNCLIWAGPMHTTGYGHLNHNGVCHRTNRLAIELFIGPLGNLCALHRCHVPSCCNPDHLYIGTHLENARDRVAAGATAFGETHGRSKLNDEKAEAVLYAHSKGCTINSIANYFGVSYAAIFDIIRRKNWKHIKIANEDA